MKKSIFLQRCSSADSAAKSRETPPILIFFELDAFKLKVELVDNRTASIKDFEVNLKKINAKEEGVTARIFNNFEDDDITNDSVLDMMETLRPEEFEEISRQSDMLRRSPIQEGIEEEPMPVIGSFLDMEEEI